MQRHTETTIDIRRNRPKFVETYNSNAPVEYQTRAVAFFDILGWRKAVDDSETDPALRRRLLNAAWWLAARSRDYIESETEINPSRDEYSQFSDSLIVSFPYKSHRDLYRLLRFVTEFQSSMLMLGLPLRGGVTVGALFHTDAIAFGPAMNRAYDLESNIAQMPRIIIDHALDRDVAKAAAGLPTHWHFVVRGDDGYQETDFLGPYAMTEKIAANLELRIDEWVDTHRGNDRVLLKYIWLKKRWEEAKKDAVWRLKIRKQLHADFLEAQQRSTGELSIDT